MANIKLTESEISKAWYAVKKDPSSTEAVEAISAVVGNNDGLICMLIKKHYATYIHSHIEDMMQEGRMAIYEHFAEFNPERGRFSTFITTYILHAISAYLCTLNGCTPHYLSNMKKYNKAYETLKKMGFENPSLSQIADEMGVGKEAASTIHKMKNRIVGVVSLDDYNPADDSGNAWQGDLEELVEDRDLSQRLSQAIMVLPEPERRVIKEMYLMGNDEPKSIRMAAENLRMKIDDVRKLKASAYRKMYNNPTLSASVEDCNHAMSAFANDITIEFAPSQTMMDNDIDTILDFAF